MIATELAQKVKQLELHTRRILSSSGIGATRSRNKGFGFDFDQLRAYQYGDDVRLIDWKSSARGQDCLYVRQFLEERNRTFIICLDVSASTKFGSGLHSKQEVMQQIAGVLTLAAAWTKDKVGLILFSDTIEKVIPPTKGQHNIHRIVEEIFAHKPQGRLTSLDVLCEYVMKVVPAKATLLVISDFIAPDFSVTLKKLAHHKNFIAITCLDEQELHMKDVGLLWMQDPETQEIVLVNTSQLQRGTSLLNFQARLKDQKKILNNSGAEVLMLRNQQSFIHELVAFFKKRMIY